MTLIITGGRGTGKTALLIKHSAETGRYILVINSDRARGIFKHAKTMGYDIPYAIAVSEFKTGSKFEGSSIRRDGLLVDDMDAVFNCMFNGIPVHEFTIDRDAFKDDFVWDRNNPYLNVEEWLYENNI